MNNDCGSNQRKFYLKSSFLNIDEQNTITSDFSILPNPNKGEMTLRFENMTGSIEVSVYDMLGILIDHFRLESESDFYTIPYHLNEVEGIYCFVASGQNGKIAKKIILAPWNDYGQ